MDNDDLTYDTTASTVFEVNRETRTIRGLVVPFNVVGDNGRGKFMFSEDTEFSWPTDLTRLKLTYPGHDQTSPIGYATEMSKTAQGIVGAFKIARGPKGDEALSAAEDHTYDGLSAGLAAAATFTSRDGVQVGITAPMGHVALTPAPAFDDARVTSVAASAVRTRKESDMDENENTDETPQEFDFAPILDKVEQAVKAQFAALTVPARERVKAGEGVTREELPYRFDGTKGEHGFLADIIAARQFGVADAAQRLDTFLAEAFDNIGTADVATLNPAPTRSELYVDALHYGRPLWNMVTTGTLEDITPFIIPKFGAVTGKPTDDHTQGTEPTAFKVNATSQTISPTPVSGLAIINREVADQGGNPQADQIIWNEMMASYFEGIEVALADLLATGTGTEINIGGGATDAAKVKLLQQAFSGFQFVKGGDRFTAFAGDPTLYGLVASAEDGNGRPLFPVFGGTNADGSKRASLESVQVGSKNIVPCWALDQANSNAESSYLFVPSSVYAWASAPRRIDIEYQVSTVSVGLWGYKAVACTRLSDIVPVDATTADA